MDECGKMSYQKVQNQLYSDASPVLQFAYVLERAAFFIAQTKLAIEQNDYEGQVRSMDRCQVLIAELSEIIQNAEESFLTIHMDYFFKEISLKLVEICKNQDVLICEWMHNALLNAAALWRSKAYSGNT